MDRRTFVQVIAVSAIILSMCPVALIIEPLPQFSVSTPVQGYSSLIPVFSPASFVSLYLQLFAMLVLTLGWKFIHRIRSPDLFLIDLQTDEHHDGEDDWEDDAGREERTKGKLGWAWKTWYFLA